MPLKADFPRVRACLFDMDGLLINSEDLYTQSINQILRRYGKPDIPWSIKAQLQGRPGSAATDIFLEWAHLPIPLDQYLVELAAVHRECFPTTGPLPGVEVLLKNLSNSNPKTHIALATSSHIVNFRLKTDHLQDLFSVFPPSQKVLGDDPRIQIGKGKPAPDIYLLALQTINETIRREGKESEIKPEECLVFEDAVPGVEAGRRAGMRVVWVPHAGLAGEFKGKEKEVLAGTTPWHSDDPEGKAALGGQPGVVDDGWGEQLESLVDFPYERYGIEI
ncbi:MAG: hypothetical protein M1814_006152 [Vezdaea aestivalis]|nr:MAG: hypothetical protein M1814_006152 [Vezdaea aestivalis]